MVKNEFISKKKISIKVVLNENSKKEFFEDIFSYISEYLNLEINYVNNFQLNNGPNQFINENEPIDFYFIDFIKEFEYVFAWNFYSKMHDINDDFKLVLFKENISNDDVKYFKNGADDIIYTSGEYYEDKDSYLRWKIFSLIRRKWDTSHSKHVLIRNGAVIDLLKRKVVLNNKEINITKKEFEVLSILVNEVNGKNNFSSKNKIFKTIYGVNNSENSRVIDQLIFRLKGKFNENFFEIDKRKGIRIR